jgi:ABC-type antimicrobial peptide transport system permease subunit
MRILGIEAHYPKRNLSGARFRVTRSTANTIGQRTREIGIRAALGAGNLSIPALVLRQSLILVTAWALVGIVAGAAAAQMLKRVLFSVDLADPATFLAMVAILVMVATPARVIPARRAIKVDPLLALRHE